MAQAASAATYRTWVLSGPDPAAGRTVVVWVDSDTALRRAPDSVPHRGRLHQGPRDLWHLARGRQLAPDDPAHRRGDIRRLPALHAARRWRLRLHGLHLGPPSRAGWSTTPMARLPLARVARSRPAPGHPAPRRARHAEAVDPRRLSVRRPRTPPCQPRPVPDLGLATGRWTVTYTRAFVDRLLQSSRSPGRAARPVGIADSYADDRQRQPGRHWCTRPRRNPARLPDQRVCREPRPRVGWRTPRSISLPRPLPAGDHQRLLHCRQRRWLPGFDGSRLAWLTIWNEAICDPRHHLPQRLAIRILRWRPPGGIQDKLDYLRPRASTPSIGPRSWASSNHR